MTGIDPATASRSLGYEDLTVTLRCSHLAANRMKRTVHLLDNVFETFGKQKLYNLMDGEG
jgi:hypothetical protein